MADPQIVLWTEGERGPRFAVDTRGIAAAGGVLRTVACRTAAERREAVGDARVLIVAHAPITDDLLAAAPRLVGLVRTGIGLDTVDLEAATRHGVCVAHVPDFCHDEVADTAWALILAVARRVVEADRQVRAGVWNQSGLLPAHRLRGQTLGLVGFGNIARKVAERAAGFGVRAVAADPYVDAAVIVRAGVEPVSLDGLFSRADIISLHTPLTSQTRGLIGTAAFARMKPGAILVNTSRGPVVDEAALIEALRSGRLAGAGLDVLAKEPPAPDNPLLRMDNVVLMPHAASTTVEAIADLAQKVSRQVIQLLRGEWPTYLANPAVRTHTACPLAAGAAQP